MTMCPSQNAERLMRDQDEPEECPVCGKPNADEQGEWVCALAPVFCSVECQSVYVADQNTRADEAASSWA